MSAFLGKIHYLLYSKIQLNEDLLDDILKLAEERKVPVREIKNAVYEKYGFPERGELEGVISLENIHGWLQGKIQSVEYRTAAVVTDLINKYGIKINEIAEIYYDNGKKIMEGLAPVEYTPKDLFMIIYDYMLEGMPCDRINQVVNDSENEFSWQTTTCIHTEYWNNVQGDVSNFYILRSAWINGLLAASDTNYSYIRTEDGYNIIK